MILAEAERRGGVPPSLCLRMVGNAAGPLLPSLAAALKQVFGKVTAVLTSYGMTECMPITSPPLDYQLDRPGTSGRAVSMAPSILDSLIANCWHLPAGHTLLPLKLRNLQVGPDLSIRDASGREGRNRVSGRFDCADNLDAAAPLRGEQQ